MRNVFILAALAAIVGGCGASAPFKYGATASGPYLQRVTDSYIQSDNALAPGDRADRLGKTATLAATTAGGGTVTVEAVEAAWADVRPMFFAYTDADPRLNRRRATTGPASLLTDRDIIQGVGKRLDALIAKEKASLFRRLAGQ